MCLRIFLQISPITGHAWVDCDTLWSEHHLSVGMFSSFFSSQESKPLEAEDHVVFQDILLIGQVNELQYFGFELVVFTVSANLLKKKPQKDCQH